MPVTIEKINRRLYNKNCANIASRAKINLSGVRLVNESKQIFFENNALNIIKNWEGLDSDIDCAFNASLECYDAMCKYASNTNIKKATEILIEGVNKVRNAGEVSRSLKYRFGRLRKNTKVIDAIGDASATNAIKQAISNLQNAIGTGQLISKSSNSDTSDTVEECYNALMSEARDIAEVDRILKQYSMVHNTYNIDKYISESAQNRLSPYSICYNIAKYIDTYNSPFINKYNTALETAWYGLNKHYIHCENAEIINGVTDYFLSHVSGDKNVFKENILKAKSISVIFTNEDFNCLSYMDDKQVQYKKSDYSSLVEDYITIGNSELNKIVNGEIKVPLTADRSSKDEDLADFITKFRKRCYDNLGSENNFVILKALVDQIINNQPTQIVFSLSQIMSIMMDIFLLDDEEFTDVKDLVKIIENIVKCILELQLTESQFNDILSTFDKVIEILSKRQESNASSRVQAYLDTLEVEANKIRNIVEDRFDVEEDDDNDDDGLEEAAEIVLVSNLLSSICEDTIEPDIDMIINGNVAKLTNNTLDALTDFSTTVPSLMDIKSLKESFIKYRAELRKKPLRDINDYIRIDCLSNNISKLEQSTPIYGTSGDIKGCIGYLMCMNELKNLNTSSESKYFSEAMSFNNTLKLAANNLKRSAVNLTGKEKSASSSIDAAIDSIAKSMQRDMSAQDRERIVRGSILPSASKCIKLALAFAGVWRFVDPTIAVISALGYFFTRKKAQRRERQLALDEIEVELKMCERYIRLYEDQQDFKKLRQCEIIQRNLERQRQRIKYKMAVDFKHANISSVTPKNNDY